MMPYDSVEHEVSRPIQLSLGRQSMTQPIFISFATGTISTA
ncbi:gp8 family protein [Neisseria shayeganii 871]|uniref:Gp8 family protein n=1 Tax=Neisseria shayeganii 871 TaxID=1032488 RepID=G4CJ50_9NEIS|nr:gp8 family protein [Neisseria shayeganii 871]